LIKTAKRAKLLLTVLVYLGNLLIFNYWMEDSQISDENTDKAIDCLRDGDYDHYFSRDRGEGEPSRIEEEASEVNNMFLNMRIDGLSV